MVLTPRPVNLHQEAAAGITLVPYFQVPEEPRFTEAGPFAALFHQQLQQISLKEGSMGLFKTMSLSNRKRMICNCLRVKKVRVTRGEAGLCHSPVSASGPSSPSGENSRVNGEDETLNLSHNLSVFAL